MTFAIEGADKATGRDVIRFIEADSEAEAVEAASEKGILVSSARRFVSPSDVDTAFTKMQKSASSADMMQLDLLQAICNHIRAIRGWVTFIGVLFLIPIIWWVWVTFIAGIYAVATHPH